MTYLDFRKSFLLLSLMLIFFLVGCSSENEDFIQGYWYRGNAHFMDQRFFDRGRFSHKTEVYHGDPNITAGRYQVIDNQDNSLTLELFDIELSFGNERQQIVIKLDWDSDTIRTRGQNYERVLP
jgi:hypothetical protein